MSIEVKEEYCARDLIVMLGLKAKKSAQKASLEYAESHHELETDLKVHAEKKRLREEVFKQLHIHKKNI